MSTDGGVGGPDRRFTEVLRGSPGEGGPPYVVRPGSAAFFGTRGLVGVGGTTDGHPFRGSFMSLGGGTHTVPVRAEIRGVIGKAEGDTVTVTVRSRSRSTLSSVSAREGRPRDIPVASRGHSGRPLEGVAERSLGRPAVKPAPGGPAVTARDGWSRRRRSTGAAAARAPPPRRRSPEAAVVPGRAAAASRPRGPVRHGRRRSRRTSPGCRPVPSARWRPATSATSTSVSRPDQRVPSARPVCVTA
ncbi:DUF1905 domain-containing protein [Streptomyces fagopyri]|uniref:DUF1905 domain-containing protein n=1 Tax=Streptomyces fagopyri TaxID=2662397 RepID=UPI0037178E13